MRGGILWPGIRIDAASPRVSRPERDFGKEIGLGQLCGISQIYRQIERIEKAVKQHTIVTLLLNDFADTYLDAHDALVETLGLFRKIFRKEICQNDIYLLAFQTDDRWQQLRICKRGDLS